MRSASSSAAQAAVRLLAAAAGGAGGHTWVVGRVACPTFVGRRAQLDRLSAAVEEAAAGRPSVVLVAGDAGVGKSRLVEELAARVRAEGMQVGIGGCVDFGQVGVPYAPVMQLLRDLADQVGPAWDQLSGDLPAELVPLLRGGHVRHEEAADGPPRRSQGRLFELALGLLVRLGESAPLVLVIEDLHWADPSTRDMVAFLARNLRRCRVAVVGTYRRDDVRRGHPLRPLLAELSRAGVERIEVGGFDRRELAAQLAGILGSRPASSMVEEVLARSEGNAFYVEELIAAAQAGEVGLPVSLREVILSRVDRLPEPSQDLLGAMAAVGRRVRHGLVERIVDLSEVDVDDALAAALGAGVLVAVPPDGYRFRHALIAEAVAAELMPGRRRRLHRRIAEILADESELAIGGASGVAGELAYHWEAAGEPERSLQAAMTAGRAAEALAAPAEAAAHFERVLSLWERVEDPESLAGADHPGVLMAAARAAHLSGARQRAVTLAATAMAEVDTSGDRVRQALIRERLGRFTWLSNDSEGAIALYEQAANLVASEPSSSAKARVLAARAQGLMVVDRHTEAIGQCHEAIAVARAVGDRAAEGQATNTLGSALANIGRWQEGVEHLRRALAIAEQSGDPEDLLRAYFNLYWVLMRMGRPDQAIDLAQSGIDAAVRFGCMGSHGRDLQINLLDVLVETGRLSEAAALLADIEPAADGRVGIRFLHASARVDLAIGDLPGAEAAINAALAAASNGEYSVDEIWVIATAAEVSLAGGKIGEARQRVVEARRLLSERENPTDRIEVAILGVHIEAEAARRGDDAAAALRRAALLLGEARQLTAALVREGGELEPGTAADLASAEAEATTVAGRPASDAWAGAIAKLDDASLVLSAARARLRCAEALLARPGSRHEATRLVAEARAVADAAGAKPLLEEADHLVARARLQLRSVQPKPASSAGLADRYHLTSRETEVLAYLAAGRTNRQIGDALFISEKTASVHVSNLLRKLGVASRIEAGAVGQHLGPP